MEKWNVADLVNLQCEEEQMQELYDLWALLAAMHLLC
jgi:hypothetical protein